MAYVEKGTQPGSLPIYNVEQPVGATGTNAQGDVKLVQYMLKNIYGAEASGLVVDGWIGPVTISWIKRFQNDAKNNGNNVLCDGRVDRAFGQVSSVSKTQYTILFLNMMLKKQNPGAYASLPSQVPLSAYPKPSPYTDKRVTSVKWIGTGYLITYSDVSTAFVPVTMPPGY